MSGRSLKAPDLGAEARAARRAQIAPGTGAGVTEPMIRELVQTFYGRVRQDPELGPIFEARVDDWEAHLAKLCDFWSSVTLMTGRFKGAPMRAHAQIPDLQPAHFERWLGLWRDTARGCCPAPAAELFIAKAEMIADSLQLGIGVSRAAPALPPARAVPADAAAYSRTPSFTEVTVPAALLQSHSTKPGVWGRIHVERGKLAYRITDPRRTSSQTVLVAGGPPGIVEPTILHEVEPQGAVTFYVEFLR